MTISEFKKYFQETLSALYTESESVFIYSIFIEKYLGLNSFEQRRFSDKEIPEDIEIILQNNVSELLTEKPYQQVLGETEFFGLIFKVSEHVLVPRPETEELLEIAIQNIKKSNLAEKAFKVLDIGTGSGIIPIILKKNFPKAEIISIDISEKAIETAKINADFHQTSIEFLQKDYLSLNLDSNFDIIISNPPYIGKNEELEIEHSVKNFEPNIALFSPLEDALIFYRKIAEDAVNHLNNDGFVFLEINQKLGPETLALYQKLSFSELIKDLSGNDRFVVAKK